MMSRWCMAVRVRALPFMLVALAPAFAAPSKDEVAIKGVVLRFEDAWNRHDMKALADLFRPDADFVNVVGARWTGRDAIFSAHQASHATIFKTSFLRIRETGIISLKKDVAVARSLWELAGHTNAAGEPQPTRKGWLTHVLVKSEGGWSIAVTQNTDLVDAKR